MKIKYSNVKFISRNGKHFSTKLRATVDKEETTGFLWWKKINKTTLEIYSGVPSCFRFIKCGGFTPIDVNRLISVHNATCDQSERLEY